MFKNFLLTAWRQLQRHRIVAAINVCGLTLGLTVFLLLMLYVRDELSWERHWQHSDRLVRLLTTNFNGDTAQTIAGGNAVFLPELLQEFDTQLEAGARNLLLRDQLLDIDGKIFPSSIFYTDAAFIDLFELNVVAGDLQYTMAAPNRVALVVEDAQRLYGSTDVLGHNLVIIGRDGVQREYEVGAVFAKPVGRTQLGFSSFTLLYEGAEEGLAKQLTTWTGFPEFGSQYFLLREGADLASLNAELPAFVDRYLPANGGRAASSVLQLRLQSLTDARFEPLMGNPGTDLEQLGIFSALACLVLGIGIVNFTTLATAQSVQRKREIGVKKAAGASNRQLLQQFVGESLLYSTVSLLLALAVCELVLPTFSSLIGSELSLQLGDPALLCFLLGLALFVGIAGGAWPGLVLARYRPERVLRRGDEAVSGSTLRLRAVLLGFQFSIAIGLMLATLVLYLQMNYMRSRNPGFIPDDVVAITGFNSGLGQPLTEGFFEQVCALPGVEDCTLASRWVSSMGGIHGKSALTRRRSDEDLLGTDDVSVGFGFFDLYRIPLLAGRAFDPALDQRDPETWSFLGEDGEDLPHRRMLLNLSAVQALGFATAEEAVGQEIYHRQAIGGEVEYRPQEIIGVVADNQLLTLREVPAPLTYSLGIPRNAFFIQARVPAAALEAVRRDSEALWQELGGQNTLYFQFAEDNIEQAFKQEALEGKLILGASMLAILLSCLGLFGLVLFELQGRTKEIGIRKALGADVRGIVAMFSLQFSRPVLLANLLAWPLAGWAMLQWLQRFPYRIDSALLLPLCLLAGALALGIALLTVALTTARAAAARPVSSLRYE